MKNVSDNLIIRVFPNSGHQYETIPLSQILPDWEDEELKALPKITNMIGDHGMPLHHG